VWARPRFKTLARLIAAAAVTAVLIVVTLAYALAVAIAAFARFVAQEWTRRRSGGASGRVRAIRR
jgi:cobalamin synthase